MAISDLSMSDHEARSSYSNPPQVRPPAAVMGTTTTTTKSNKKNTTAAQQNNTIEAKTTKPRSRWGQRLRHRLFGSGGGGGGKSNKNRRGTMERASSSSRLFARRQQRTPPQAQHSMSALTQSNNNLPQYNDSTLTDGSREPQSYGGTPSAPPTAFHASFYSAGGGGDGDSGYHQSSTAVSMSARDFRQPMNSYAYAREDESYTNLANQQIDEDLEVSYFNP